MSQWLFMMQRFFISKKILWKRWKIIPKKIQILCLLLLFLQIFANQNKNNNILKLRAHVIKRLPHPFNAYTQGLVQINGKIYESSGLYGQSFISQYSLKNPLATVRKKNLPKNIFAEGIAPKDRKGQEIILLTWKENLFFTISSDFSEKWSIKSNFFDREGWGIAFDGENFISSDDGNYLTFRDKDLLPIRSLKKKNNLFTLSVLRNNERVKKINELEYAPLLLGNKKVFLWANVWGSDFLAAIDKKGNIIAEVDCRHLAKENRPTQYVQKNWGIVLNTTPHPQRYQKALNGIAYLGNKDKIHEKLLKNAHFLLTGKKWKWLYIVHFSKKILRRNIIAPSVTVKK